MQIRTLTSGYQIASIFHSAHREDLKEINTGVRKLIEVYKAMVEQVLKSKYDTKNSVSKQEILDSGYDNSLLPKDDEDDIF
ncbi:hypothetical protein [Aquimarina sp. 2201CG5-10]|uniref:hypothetical protein n=1 Tax=Aquimarina callyspongiae TaxID=3098150 RepID=UPI002AB5ADE9|nr:hypothetical protein [Aquimarina sp. 2201CG5-10]MDY8135404.1 hypothetical protein [Aquimarina sp. 2201CG5-10]